MRTRALQARPSMSFTKCKNRSGVFFFFFFFGGGDVQHIPTKFFLAKYHKENKV